MSHGFYTPTGCTLVYLLTREYDGSDEYGWNATDPTWQGWGKWGVILNQNYGALLFAGSRYTGYVTV